jgi:hypothetical protein
MTKYIQIMTKIKFNLYYKQRLNQSLDQTSK